MGQLHIIFLYGIIFVMLGIAYRYHCDLSDILIDMSKHIDKLTEELNQIKIKLESKEK